MQKKKKKVSMKKAFVCIKATKKKILTEEGQHVLTLISEMAAFIPTRIVAAVNRRHGHELSNNTADKRP